MIYDIRHLTTYSYGAPVSLARCTLRLTPASGPGQRVVWSRLQVTPAPASRTARTNFFGCDVVAVTVETPHRELKVEARSRIEVSREPPAAQETSRPWEEVREEALAVTTLALDSPVHHLFPSRLVTPFEPLTHYGAESFPTGRPMIAGVSELMHRIKADFAYDPKATAVSTPLAQAFETRRGVCQDFAHIMIAALRGLGLPAAYVSGYIRTVPPPGKPRLEGADATHAWVSVWCGAEHGWLGFDPTNDLRVVNDHIVLAVGRDYADISPIDGIILGAGEQGLDVKVDVLPVG